MTKPGLSILIANIVMSGRSGTEIITRTLAEGLLTRGHRPIIYTSSMGPLAHELRAMSIPVTDDIGQVQCRPDIIHGHHNPTTAAAVARFPDVPALFVCHDFVAWHSGPPALPQIRRFAAISEATATRLCAEHGIPPDRVSLLLNPVDTKRFRRTRSLPDKPKRLLAYTNYSAHIEALRAACSLRNLDLEIVGAAVGRENSEPERLLPGFDMVFTSGLGAMEAMACGASVILCDGRGIAGMITEDRFAAWRRAAFGLRVLRRPVTAEIVAGEIDKYDAGAATRVSDLLRQEAGMEQYLDRVEELHERVIADHRTTGPSPSADSAIALARHIEHWGPHEPVAAALTRDRLRLLESLLHVRTGLGVVERGGTCEFGLDGDHAWLGLYGFSNPEERGVWSVGRDAMLLLNADLVGDVVLSWRVRSHVHQQNPILQCNVFVNGRACGDWTFSYPDDRGAVTRTLNFTANARDRMAFFIRFALSEVVSPSELGVSADARSLGIWLEAVTVQPAPSNAPTQRVF